MVSLKAAGLSMCDLLVDIRHQRVKADFRRVLAYCAFTGLLLLHIIIVSHLNDARRIILAIINFLVYSSDLHWTFQSSKTSDPLTLSWRRSLPYRTRSLICKSKDWTGFYMIRNSTMTELNNLRSCYVFVNK